MAINAGKLLVVESDEQLRGSIVSALNEAGYEVSTDVSAGMKSVLAFEPDLVVLGADPPDLNCCDLLSEIKGTERTREIRVVMLSHGGAAERARGLDLGADDALSLPFEPHELLSRIRAQLREREQLRRAEEDRKATEQVVTAVNEERRTVRVGALVTVLVLLAAGLVSVYFYRRTQAQNARVYAAITRLQSGMLSQSQLIQMSRKASDSVVQSRLSKLESEGSVAQTIIQTYEPSVCLIHITLAFRDHTSGQKLHYAGMTDSGGPTLDEHNNPLVSLTGYGPEVHIDAFGTGFLASANGEILTNHHVAEPWWQNDEIKELLSQGLDPVVTEMRAYFPDVPHGITIDTERISTTADVAIVRGDVSGLGIKTVALADGQGAAISGAPVVLLGYPTAIDAILARAGSETIQSIAHASKGDPSQVMEELAKRHLIRPTTTQGHIGDVLADKIVYDAQTTSGGSGGPLFNDQGKVIGINFAILRQFGGSNFAIPIDFGQALLTGSTDRAGPGTAAR
ncbi:MAG TPA: trypsin-like peptidase domain-containing protein [Gemmatimonadaceae bacterium]|nr:trypsin-like peptidase domain-containing protein [Gemmatimonadaceae bacterium]